ncbi:MAG: hypothetical protein KDJ97_20510 [Anaerolineae bacterium]|nr:hypothetical protein [Anaerolineae bacterium]
MYPVQLATSSAYQVDIPTPKQPAKLITAGQNFVKYDESLPPEEQSYLLPDLKYLLQDCVPTQKIYKSSEVQRTIASEAVKRLDEQAKALIHKIRYKLNFDYTETPEAAEEWGFEVKQGTRNILMPRKLSDRLALLDTYIAKEESRAPEERFSKPNLEDVIRLRDDLKANLDIRRASRSRRKDSYAARAESLEALYDTLRMAGGLIILKKFNRKLTPGLENWGIEVTKRQSKEKDTEVAPAANGTTTTATNGSETTTNGAATTTTTSAETTTTNGAETTAETSTNGSVDLNGTSEVVVELGEQG